MCAGVILSLVVIGLIAPIEEARSWNPITMWRIAWESPNNPVLILFAPEAASHHRAAAGAICTTGCGLCTWAASHALRIPALSKGVGFSLTSGTRDVYLNDRQTPAPTPRKYISSPARGKQILSPGFQLHSQHVNEWAWPRGYPKYVLQRIMDLSLQTRKWYSTRGGEKWRDLDLSSSRRALRF